MSSPTWKSPCGKRVCFPTPRLFKWAWSVEDTSLSCCSHLVWQLSIEKTVPSSWITQHSHPVVLTCFLRLCCSWGLQAFLRRSQEQDACSGLHPGLHGSSYSQWDSSTNYLGPKLSWVSSSFLFKAHLHNFGENLMLLKMSRCALSFVGCVGGGTVVPRWIIMTLLSSSHCKSILQSGCLPDVWLQHIGVKIFYSCCEKFNIFCSLLSSWYSPSQSCCSAIARMIFILSWYGGGISRIQPTLGFCEICCWKEFWSS